MPTSCHRTGLDIPECSCAKCSQAAFDLYYARREAAAIARGEPSPEQIGHHQAREEIARPIREPIN